MQILWGNEYKICKNDHTITHPMFGYAHQHQYPILCTAHVIVWLSVGVGPAPQIKSSTIDVRPG
jgi:hypothetical protein